MHRLLITLVVVSLLSGCAMFQRSPKQLAAQAVDAPARSTADRERDAREHPEEVLALAAFERGDVVADVFAGGGYYSELLAHIVGPEGQVLLVNNPPYDEFGKRDWEARLADNRLLNVRHVVGPTTALGLAPASLDGAVMVMGYHDLYWVEEKAGWPAVDAPQFLAQVVAALKPGGKLLLVDHRAAEGSGSAAASNLHRIDEQFAINDWKQAGLEWVASIPLLRNPEDDHSKSVFDPAIRGRTDRFVHLYRKPD